jgi:tetratricopeptide (TPR) repeat protein
MKRSLWLGLVAVVVVAAAISIIALPKGPEWTTSSPKALAEFELALQSKMKLYHLDAIAHLEEAVKLDPDFVMARLLLADYARYTDRTDGEELMQKVFEADVDSLRPRERFYVERMRAIRDKRTEDADRLLTEYRERYPDDPYILETAANNAFAHGDSGEAERLYRRLIEVGPNWVIAYNQLGYLTMREGRFSEAEEYLTSYRFIAPDQANPHDSLGEMYVILGRLPEAVQSFETALEIKPDFWESYSHLVLARVLLQDFAGAAEAVATARGVPNCPNELPQTLACLASCLEIEMAGRWSEMLEPASATCAHDSSPLDVCPRVAHRAACQLGDWQAAQAAEDALGAFLSKIKETGESMQVEEASTTLLHMQGVRLALSGDLAGAEKAFTEVDGLLSYYNSFVGLFKLYNRLFLVETLLAQHRDAEAHQMLAKVRAVNPWLVTRFEESGLKLMGLPRG